VVVKTLADHLAGDPGRRARFLRAVELGMRLSHPNIVRIFEAGIEGRPYVVMEHIDGESLAERTQRRGRLSAAETLRLATHLAAGLAHAHANGVVHGAFAPQSIVVGRDGVARIEDFAFARLLAGADRPDPAEDVHGLALVLSDAGAERLPPGLTSVIEAAADTSARLSAFDVFHHIVTLNGPAEVWLPPAGVHDASACGMSPSSKRPSCSPAT
jgi:serine/threonine protein kinase